MNKISRRIGREAGIPNLTDILAEKISPTDLQSLLIELYKRIAKRRKPPTLLSDYVQNRFTQPSKVNPSLVVEWDRVALSHLPDDFEALELSPACPLGSVSTIAPVTQDWVLTTIRNTEVVSDATNVLALECAVRRKKLTKSSPDNASVVNLASSHRVLRTQQYRDANALHHFRLFSLCTAGRDTGSFRFEKAAFTAHIRFYIQALAQFLGPHIPLRVTINDLSQGSRHAAALTTIVEDLKKEFTRTHIELEESGSTTRGYYQQFRFHIHADQKGHWVELVDGGDTDWTRKLLNNAKERLVTSAIGSERLCAVFGSRQID